ncbi:MAG: WxcM-like domain-containing protein [Sedimentisphaerales bacterium]|nr:WxcM-like domain-containing protein [Sedimentisphaerales bacterium]
MGKYFKHPQSVVETDNIGKNTRVWAFVHILPGARIGSDCNICDHVFIENDVTVGDRVTIKSGVQLWDGLHIEDDVFVGPNVTFTNDIFPRSRQHPEKFLKTSIKIGASIGANATILPGITIGRNAMIGGGAVVTRDVPPNAIAVGNPAYINGYVSTLSSKQPSRLEVPTQPSPGEIISNVRGVKIYNLPIVIDLRGSLSFAEYGQYLPFIPKRYFLVFDVASKEIRGEHAHRTLHQFLVCIKGSCALVVDDSQNSQEIVLDRPNIGVFLPPMLWGIQYKYSRDAILLVLASDIYDADDYIRDYDEYLKEIK